MCGISGFNWEDKEKAITMMHSLAHRGPDAEGVFTSRGVSLGHNRLSVIDLSTAANQPMHDSAGELTIVFNGEIYNFKALREELKEYSFKTKSDTEVILAGYKKWGKGVVEKLNGMFAFAIWDKRDGSLFCARDHAGIKPFYYYWDGDQFIFASEVKAIFAHNVPRVLDPNAFNHYLRVLYVPEPMTMTRNVFKLPPRSTLTLRNKQLLVEPYQSTLRQSAPASYKEAAVSLREKVINAVGRQLVSDVPVGVYLSGGIDSSAVLFSMSQFTNKVQSFSVGFSLEAGEEREKFNKDFELAKMTADFFGAAHNPILISAKDVCQSMETAVAQCDDPVSNPTAVPMMHLAQFAKKQVSVVLTGSGGDELFGGYERYQLALVAHHYRNLPRSVRRVLSLHPKVSKLDQGQNIDLFAQLLFQKDTVLTRVVSPYILRAGTETGTYFQERYLDHHSGDPAEQFMKVDQESWLPDFFFMLSDKMSMASALEERVPLTDKELVAFADSLPREYKVNLFDKKRILKEAFKDDLPDFLFSQPKRGWFSPGAKWLRHPDFSAFASQVLSPEYHSGTRDLFKWTELQDMLQMHVEKKEYHLTLLWAVLTFQIWAKTYRITT